MTLIVHHLRVSQSERITWLCEELGIEYTLKVHERDPLFSPKSIKDLTPLGQAPVIQDGDITLAESAACVDYINFKLGGGRMALAPSHPRYADYLYWFHFANCQLQPMFSRVMSNHFIGADAGHTWVQRTQGQLDRYLTLMDDRLAANEWLAGPDFTAADCMTVFTLTTMRAFYPLDISKYGNILKYLKRVSERPAYKRAMEKGDPGMKPMIDGPAPEQFTDQLKAQGKM